MRRVPMMSCADGKSRAELGALGKCDALTPYVKTANYAMVLADAGKVFSNSGATGTITFTLPTTAKAGFHFYVLKPTAQAITFARAAGVKINGADADLTVAAGTVGIIEIASDGTEWFLRTAPESVDLDAVEQGTDGQLIIGQTGAAPAYKTVSGDMTINKDGVTAIGASKVLSSMNHETLVRYAEVALTNSQIKNLRATPITLVAAPGAGKVIELLSATLLLDYGSNVLTRPNGDEDFVVRYENGAGAVASVPSHADFPVASADTIGILGPAATAALAASGTVNKALVLHNDGTGEFGGNAGADTVLRVKVAYRVHTTAF